MDLKELKELIESVDRSTIVRFELEQDGVRLCLEKALAASVPVAVSAPVPSPVVVPAVRVAGPVASLGAPEPADVSLQAVTSPMVGVFYEAPQPGTPPFVKVGDTIRKGQVLCIIEAMKLMNEVVAEVEGVLVQVLAKNEEMVEYGQPLFKVKR